MDTSNNNFVELLGADIAKNEQLLKDQPIMPPQPYNGADFGYNKGLSDEQIQEIAKASKLDLKTDAEKPPHCLWIDGQPVSDLGDFSTTIGKAKSRKTFATGLLVASLVGNTDIQGRIRGGLPEDKRNVLYFDTEQSNYYAQRSARRIYGLLDKNHYHDTLPNFHVYSLRPFTPQERLQIIEYLIYNTPNLGFVVIDGIRDLITSINDEEQATMITSKLLKWSTERMIHINCILHMNKGDNNARGHVGTELMNKSLTVLGVNKLEKNEDYSTIEPIATRDREFKPIVFGIDEEGLPYILSDNDSDALKTKTGREKDKQITDWTDEQHSEILERMFDNEPQMNYEALTRAVALIYKIGISKAKTFISYFRQNKLVNYGKKGSATIYSRV